MSVYILYCMLEEPYYLHNNTLILFPYTFVTKSRKITEYMGTHEVIMLSVLLLSKNFHIVKVLRIINKLLITF